MSAATSPDLATEVEELLQFLYASPVGLLSLDNDGTIRLINPVAMQLLMLLPGAAPIGNFFSVMEGFAPELRNMVDAYRDANGAVCENHRIFIMPGAGSGDISTPVLACTLVKLGSERFIATLADVSRQVAQERRLKQAETWFASLLDQVNDFAVISLDAEGRIDRINPSVSRQTGFAEPEVIGRTLDVFQPDDPTLGQSAPQHVAAARSNGWHLEESWHRRRDGSRYWCQALIAARGEDTVDDETRISGYTVVLRDVTRQNSNSAKLRQLLTTDHLTGAYNRAHFFEVATRECSRFELQCVPSSLVMLDIDHFKRLNDSYGHAAGDDVLKAVAEACIKTLRPSDTFARLGGEEFAVLLPATVLQEAAEIAERLRAAIESIDVRAATGCTASFGCSTLDGVVRDVADLMAAADAALYSAKRGGRNRVVVKVSGLRAA